MSTRQIRLSGLKIKKEAPKLLGHTVSLVLKNRSVIHAEILSMENDIFQVKDAGLRKHRISLSDISEIIKDINA